jgi:hypothetical protein
VVAMVLQVVAMVLQMVATLLQIQTYAKVSGEFDKWK